MLGRDILSATEIREMIEAEAVVQAYNSRKMYRNADGEQDWGEWALEHPIASRLLDRAMLAAESERKNA